MRTPPSSLAACPPLLLVCIAIANAAGAESRDETERWVPAIGATSGIIAQGADASVTSSDITYTLTTRAPVNLMEVVTVTTVTNEHLRPPKDGDDMLVTPWVGGTAELMTPGIQSLPGRPRLFARSDIGAAFGTERKVARERSPTSLPEVLPTEPYVSEEAVDGIGSQTTAEVQPLFISAGAGIAFTLDLFERRIRIKPSVEYSREEIDFTGKVNRAVNTDTGIPTFGPIQRKDSKFFGIEIRGEDSEVFEAVGAGLELEMDTVRAGPFMIAVFLQARGLKLLGDTEVAFSGETTVSQPELTPNPDTFTADWSFDKDDWTYGGGLGFRFRWLPD